MKKPGQVDEKHDCKATLDDQQVMDFCRNGYLKLEGVVPDKINTRVIDFLDTHDSAEPSEILAEDWGDQEPPSRRGGQVVTRQELRTPAPDIQPPSPLSGAYH